MMLWKPCWLLLLRCVVLLVSFIVWEFFPLLVGVLFPFFFLKTIVVVLLYYTNIPGKKRKPPTMLAGPNAIDPENKMQQPHVWVVRIWVLSFFSLLFHFFCIFLSQLIMHGKLSPFLLTIFSIIKLYCII